MTVYESLITEDKQRPCPSLNPCCEEFCDEPSFWDLLPQCQLNWIALGLVALAIGFGLIGLGAINIGNVANLGNPPINTLFDSATLAQGTRFIVFILGAIALSALIFFKSCNDDWRIVIVGSLVGASAFPLATIGLVYHSIAEFVTRYTSFDRTWFNIALSLIVLSIASFLFLAYFLYYSSCHRCISAKKAIIVSLIFLIGGSAAYSLGRLLWIAAITNQFYVKLIPPYTFPPSLASAFEAFIFVSIVNIILVVALGWYILDCAVENCLFAFLPLFASAASLGNWALYRVGLNVLSYQFFSNGIPNNLIQFAIAIGLVSITALILAFKIAKCDNIIDALVAASSIPLLYAIATYTYVATAANLTGIGRYVDDILIGIFVAIGITAVINFFLRSSVTCPISTIIYGFASGSFGWAIIYLYSTYSSNILENSSTHITDSTALNIGLITIFGIVITSIRRVRFVACDELLSALTLLNTALLTVSYGGFYGTTVYYSSGIVASWVLYVIFFSAADFLPRFFASCEDSKRQLVIAVASLSAGIAAVDLGRAIALALAIVFGTQNLSNITFSTLIYIASAFGTTFLGQAVVWKMPQSNICTALLASFMGLVAGGIALQVIIFVIGAGSNSGQEAFELVGTPWLIFTLVLVALLLLLQLKSLCIPQHCRFSPGLLIPALSIAVVGKIAGASAALGTVYSFSHTMTKSFLAISTVNSRVILLNLIIPLAAFFISLKIFDCTTHLSYLPTSIAFIAVIYATSQFELFNVFIIPHNFLIIFIPFLNTITQIYLRFYFGTNDPDTISSYATFITQTGLVYLLFLAPALIAGFVFTCSKQTSAAVLGTAIATTAVSLGAVGIANIISGILNALGFITIPINTVITFAEFLEGIQSQFILFVVGVLTALFIHLGECCYSKY